MKTLIFLDDERDFEDVTWVEYPKFDEVIVVRDSEEFFDVLDAYVEDDVWVSFDHDIACYGKRIEEVFGVQQTVEGEINGEYCCKIALQKGFNPHQMLVHSKNPVGASNIRNAIESAKGGVGMSGFSEYKNFEIVRDGRRFYFVRHKLSQRNVITFVLSGCKYDAFFCHTAFNQYLLSEALRMLEFLNKTVAIDSQPC